MKLYPTDRSLTAHSPGLVRLLMLRGYKDARKFAVTLRRMGLVQHGDWRLEQTNSPAFDGWLVVVPTMSAHEEEQLRAAHRAWLGNQTLEEAADAGRRAKQKLGRPRKNRGLFNAEGMGFANPVGFGYVPRSMMEMYKKSPVPHHESNPKSLSGWITPTGGWLGAISDMFDHIKTLVRHGHHEKIGISGADKTVYHHLGEITRAVLAGYSRVQSISRGELHVETLAEKIPLVEAWMRRHADPSVKLIHVNVVTPQGNSGTIRTIELSHVPKLPSSRHPLHLAARFPDMDHARHAADVLSDRLQSYVTVTLDGVRELGLHVSMPGKRDREHNHESFVHHVKGMVARLGGEVTRVMDSTVSNSL